MMKLVAGKGFEPVGLACEVPSTAELGLSAVLAVAFLPTRSYAHRQGGTYAYADAPLP